MIIGIVAAVIALICVVLRLADIMKEAEEVAKIEEKYLNSWNAYEGAQYNADGEREKYRARAEKLGIDAANIWLDFD